MANIPLHDVLSQTLGLKPGEALTAELLDEMIAEEEAREAAEEARANNVKDPRNSASNAGASETGEDR